MVDFPWVADRCGCGHVHAANQEHCLQSVERCRQPARWRNKQECNIVSGASGMAGDYGTEYDWMGFLYSINRPTVATAPPVATNDLWLIYRHACTQAEAPLGSPPKATPDMCKERPFVWDASSTSATPQLGKNPDGTTELRKVGGFVQGLDAKYLTDPTTRDKARADADLYGVSADTAALP